jgi:hypothetical protein
MSIGVAVRQTVADPAVAAVARSTGELRLLDARRCDSRPLGGAAA